jgi:phosphoribosylanthranilate isomerase
MVRVKICGITNLDDARAAIAAGADMLGFNFYRPSPRFIEPGEAEKIIGAVRAETESRSLMYVGVFADEATPDSVRRIVAAAGVNPLVHFLQFGQHEGRAPFADSVWG